MEEAKTTEVVVPGGTTVWLTVNEGDRILVRGTVHPDNVPGIIEIDQSGTMAQATTGQKESPYP